ncbi:nuclear mRNA export, poly(A)+RNA binding protein [Trapelia coarctata]|nr:nuclear mRNA export, poly(A)+RNA binding protein [Trapelia coarctata]
MLSTPPSGPRASRGVRTSRSPHPTTRGGIHKRNGGPIRVDRDGDLDMDVTPGSGRGSIQGRGNRGRGQVQNQTTSTRPAARNPFPRGSLDPATIQKAIARGLSSGNAILREQKGGIRMAGVLSEAAGDRRNRHLTKGLDQITVRGWTESKAASNVGGGIKELLGFLERKATPANAPESEMVRIKKSHTRGDTLYIYVKPEDTAKIARLDNFSFAGAPLKIEAPPPPPPPPPSETISSETTQLKDKMAAMLTRRYNPELRLLDLSALGTDPEFANTGMFDTAARQSKFFPALMKVCDSVFTSLEQKREAVVSVTLANNNLHNLSSVTTLSQTFPELKNLDLSNNDLKNMAAIEVWRWRFRLLDHLVLAGNPIETTEPAYKDDLLKWFPKLRTLNSVQVRTDEEIAAAAPKSRLPIAVHPPSFRDEATIGETFVKNFFVGYDTDRSALASAFYDTESTFSLSINVSALRASETTETRPQPWDFYIKKSRNLTKITTLPGRMDRLYKGTEKVRDIWLTLPSTRHPDFATESEKWCIECHTLPGLPDPSGQSAGGVGGMIVMVHGEFGEVDVSTNNITGRRSFDRTFVLGPGGGVGGVRVVSDMLVVRAYGGYEAWKPNVQPQTPPTLQYQSPEGFGVGLPGKSDEQVQKELLAMELTKATGMILEYSGMCLEQSAWNLEEAGKAFEQVKATLPAEAFI